MRAQCERVLVELSIHILQLPWLLVLVPAVWGENCLYYLSSSHFMLTGITPTAIHLPRTVINDVSSSR